MKTISKILVAVDFSEYSLFAAQYAAKLARDVGATMLLANVLNQRDISMMEMVATRIPEFPIEQHIKENLQDRRDRLDELARKLEGPDLAVQTDVRTGVPYEVLLLVIQELKPDLLVMGTKGRTNLMDALIGSCAQKLFRRSPIPLLSLRGAETD